MTAGVLLFHLGGEGGGVQGAGEEESWAGHQCARGRREVLGGFRVPGEGGPGGHQGTWGRREVLGASGCLGKEGGPRGLREGC